MAVLACGTMGTAILSGVLDFQLSMENGHISKDVAATSHHGESFERVPLPKKYIATVGRDSTAKRLASTFSEAGHSNVEVFQQRNVEAVRRSDIVLLCTKPQRVSEFMSEPGMKEALENKILVSIAAGTTINTIQKVVPPSTKVVRAMPNTPCRIREGMTVISDVKWLTHLERDLIATIFSAVGKCNFLDEKYFDAATALAGSGPAFVTLFLEAMTDGGVMMGLPRAEALELAAQTMQGAARMVLESGSHPAAIKDSVTTPGGCTIAGLLQMEDGRVRSTVARTIQTAAEHAAGLGKSS
ncbi:pyrroline-5-carboxylate reductase [Malassezia arunalokei]|uniref:Pyrroline-5-carboxylate reductase n=1 Tax=Malassezia arunalokei TaxID=1514897 RepID=A0AAJ5Z0H2_9BASI|nr:pyrroline-5-carboxylate reductase [Malassezia arunalokei]